MQRSTGFRGVGACIYQEVKLNDLINCSKDAMPARISLCLQLRFGVRGYCTVSTAGIAAELAQ